MAAIAIAGLLWPSLRPTSASGIVPPNDNFPGTPITFLPFSDGPSSTAKATTEVGEPSPCGGIAKDVWYTFTPSATTVVQADTISSDYDTVLAVYTGPGLPTLVNVACNDDFFGKQSKIQFTATAGTTYRIQVGGFNAATGNVVFHLAPPPPPPNPPANDNLTAAGEIPNGGIGEKVYTGTATTQIGEPSPCGGIARTVWYQFYAAANYDTVQVQTFAPDGSNSSDYDTVVAVYTGPQSPTMFSQLDPVTCSQDPSGYQSSLAFSATAGTTYHIQVGGYGGSVGNLHFSLTIPPPPPTPTNTPKPSPTPKATPTPNPSSNGSLVIDADCEGPLDPQKDFGITKQRSVLAGQSFHVCVTVPQGGVPTGGYAGYRLRLHWDEALFDLNARNALLNDQWGDNGGPSPSSPLCRQRKPGEPLPPPYDQQLIPLDDDAGTDAFIWLECTADMQLAQNTSKEGPLAQFEFTCAAAAHASANLFLVGPPDSTKSGISAQFMQVPGFVTVKPSLKAAVINCLQPSYDSDNDGCTNAQELQTAPGSEFTGGRRDPLNQWDYFNPSHDGQNRVDDILLTVLAYFKDRWLDPPTNTIPNPAYNPDTDRTLKQPNPDPWRTGPPDGQQRVDDIVNALHQYFHDCA